MYTLYRPTPEFCDFFKTSYPEPLETYLVSNGVYIWWFDTLNLLNFAIARVNSSDGNSRLYYQERLPNFESMLIPLATFNSLGQLYQTHPELLL